jgi:4-hydroxy-2-oxoheptanedioate aldolase
MAPPSRARQRRLPFAGELGYHHAVAPARTLPPGAGEFPIPRFPVPTRINKVIELLEQGQPVYYVEVRGGPELSHEAGRALAKTWADYISVEMEHGAFDLAALDAFMRGLVAGGPTASGHRTPAVIVQLPVEGSSEPVIRANAWQFRQALARGVHGVLLCHVESPQAVRAFVESCRYPFHQHGLSDHPDVGLGEGRRGSAGQDTAAEIWGLSPQEYLARADPWPLNPRGELLLGIKIENRRALARAEASASVPGIAFAEWGPGDMGFSFGYPDRHDPPYPPELEAARERVRAACRAAGLRFLNLVSPEDVVRQIGEGVMICAPGAAAEEAARLGRAHTRRLLPV